MPCQLCIHDPTTDPPRPYHCPTCVASALHPLRLSLARRLLANDALRTRIDALSAPHSSQSAADLAPGNLTLALGDWTDDPTPDGDRDGGDTGFIDLNEAARAEAYRRLRAEIRAADDRAAEARRRAETLRREVEALRREVEARREVVRRRRGDAESAAHGLARREEGAVEELRRAVGRGEVKGTAVLRQVVAARRVLCRELGELAGLRRRKRRGRDGTTREEWMLGGVKVWDLRDMSAAEPHRLTTSLTNIAYLTVRASHYLALRLPAEITLPHRDYPLPTILHPSSSYRASSLPFPGTTPNTSSTPSPTASRSALPTISPRDLPVPRLLFLDKSLSELHKSDPLPFKNVVEGAVLLAWDVAWLCRAAGVAALDRWDEIADVGRNLHALLVMGTRAEAQGGARVSLPGRARSGTPGSPARGAADGEDDAGVPSFGARSHGTALGFFGGAGTAGYMQAWAHRSPSVCVDRVRACLVERIRGAEWEVLDERWVEEIMEGGIGEEEWVVDVGRRRREAGRNGGEGMGKEEDGVGK